MLTTTKQKNQTDYIVASVWFSVVAGKWKKRHYKQCQSRAIFLNSDSIEVSEPTRFNRYQFNLNGSFKVTGFRTGLLRELEGKPIQHQSALLGAGHGSEEFSHLQNFRHQRQTKKLIPVSLLGRKTATLLVLSHFNNGQMD
ncbi:MAG: hypothetical protein IPL27_29000 [Lewinellaceae bacterium]|nr:hypothetical protein [Lewinellaceae bacterium]